MKPDQFTEYLNAWGNFMQKTSPFMTDAMYFVTIASFLQPLLEAIENHGQAQKLFTNQKSQFQQLIQKIDQTLQGSYYNTGLIFQKTQITPEMSYMHNLLNGVVALSTNTSDCDTNTQQSFIDFYTAVQQKEGMPDINKIFFDLFNSMNQETFNLFASLLIENQTLEDVKNAIEKYGICDMFKSTFNAITESQESAKITKSDLNAITKFLSEFQKYSSLLLSVSEIIASTTELLTSLAKQYNAHENNEEEQQEDSQEKEQGHIIEQDSAKIEPHDFPKLYQLRGLVSQSYSESDVSKKQEIAGKIKEILLSDSEGPCYLYSFKTGEGCVRAQGKNIIEMAPNNTILLWSIVTEEYELTKLFIKDAKTKLSKEQYHEFISYQYVPFNDGYSKMWINTATTLLANRGNYDIIEKLVNDKVDLKGHNEKGVTLLSFLLYRLPLETIENQQKITKIIDQMHVNDSSIWNIVDAQCCKPIDSLAKAIPQSSDSWIEWMSWGDKVMGHHSQHTLNFIPGRDELKSVFFHSEHGRIMIKHLEELSGQTIEGIQEEEALMLNQLYIAES
jgi:hypothetical protein